MRPKDPTSSTTDQRAKGRSVSPQGGTLPGWIACDRLVGVDPTALRSWRPTVGPSPSTDRASGRRGIRGGRSLLPGQVGSVIVEHWLRRLNGLPDSIGLRLPREE